LLRLRAQQRFVVIMALAHSLSGKGGLPPVEEPASSSPDFVNLCQKWWVDFQGFNPRKAVGMRRALMSPLIREPGCRPVVSYSPARLAPAQTFPGSYVKTSTRKVPSVAMVLPCLLLVLPVAAQAEFTYTTDDNTVTITGYAGSGGAVTIPSTTNNLPVTRIGPLAFFGNPYLTSITIPESVTNIDDAAFSSCTSLTLITVAEFNPAYCDVAGVLFNLGTNTLIQYPGGKAGGFLLPNSVTRIGDSAFDWCVNLTSLALGDGVTEIPAQAFYNCSSLASIAIGSNVITIGGSAFVDCRSLTAITVDALNPVYGSVDGVLFDRSTNTLLQFPRGLAGSYTIPDSVTRIGNCAFRSCTSLTNVSLGTSITNIGNDAFGYCSGLTSVVIPDNVTHLGAWAFRFCTNLTNLTIGRSVTHLGDEAFSYCTSLTRLTIPGSVSSLGDWLCSNCRNLTEVYFSGDAPSPGSEVFYKATNAVIYCLPGTAGWETTFGDRPTALWLPRVQTGDASLGVRTNQFGFNILWADGMSIVVEACTDPANPIWTPLQTNTLTGDTVYFSDPQWADFPARFYRLRWP
jgi:hypothetical protein